MAWDPLKNCFQEQNWNLCTKQKKICGAQEFCFINMETILQKWKMCIKQAIILHCFCQRRKNRSVEIDHLGRESIACTVLYHAIISERRRLERLRKFSDFSRRSSSLGWRENLFNYTFWKGNSFLIIQICGSWFNSICDCVGEGCIYHFSFIIIPFIFVSIFLRLFNMSKFIRKLSFKFVCKLLRLYLERDTILSVEQKYLEDDELDTWEVNFLKGSKEIFTVPSSFWVL